LFTFFSSKKLIYFPGRKAAPPSYPERTISSIRRFNPLNSRLCNILLGSRLSEN